MFARVLYLDHEMALELNWFGAGALQVRHRLGGVRRAHPIQKQLFLAVVTQFEAAGQPVHPSNPRCMNMMREFADSIANYPPNSLRWQVLFNSDPAVLGRTYADGV